MFATRDHGPGRVDPEDGISPLDEIARNRFDHATTDVEDRSPLRYASQEPVEPCPFLQDASTIAIVVARVTVVSIDDFVVAHTHGQPRKPVRLPYGLLPLVDRNGVDRLSAGVCALVGDGPGFSVG